ncbi:MAG: hypothetical protein PVSMB11_02070 [Desulfuromonadaceae bacterium]
MSEGFRNKLLVAGGLGVVVTALCCFTPVLTILLATMGLGAVLGYLDYILLPALALFVGIILFALTREKKSNATGRKP